MSNESDKVSLSEHEGAVTCLALSCDGKFIASGGTDKSIILWDASSKQKLKSLSGHTNTITSIVFN